MKMPSDLLCDPEAVRRTAAVAPQLERAAMLDNSEPILGMAQIVELILKDRDRLDRLAQVTERKVDLASRLLAISLVSFALYGLGMSLTLYSAHFWPRFAASADWLNGSETRVLEFVHLDTAPSHVAARSLRLILAYSFGLIAASGICLPSLYFYGLLSGLRMTMTDVVVHSLKCTAVAAVALIGILPIYSALVLGAIVFPFPHNFVAAILLLGLCLPFIGGLWGTRSLFVGFASLCRTMPPEFQSQRACFLRRLILSWCACYTSVAPLMIVTVWRHLGS
ncbi:MAG TPA: hypothetical protein VFG04_09610 [Planctomycetaceae bacterium]|jgi:hypothetical protein|nr:hypothetical protein [Planctomycetaceae bacterium]